MNKEPWVTVIIPYKSRPELLFDTLDSIFKQTYKNYKVLIIYDNENKIDLTKIKKFIESKNKKFSRIVKVEINKENIGAGKSRNKGIKKSNSKYVAFLDSDDLWSKNKLKLQIEFMEKKKLFFSHTSYQVINEKNQKIEIKKAKKIITFKDLIKSCDIGLSTVIVNRKFLKSYNLYFPNITTKEDFVLWLKIVKETKFIVGMNKKLTYYRKTKNSLSSNKLIGLINAYKVYRNYMNFSQLKSLFYVIILSINFLKKNFNNDKAF